MRHIRRGRINFIKKFWERVAKKILENKLIIKEMWLGRDNKIYNRLI